MVDYVVEFKSGEKPITRILIEDKGSNHVTHILAIKQLAKLLMDNTITEIIVYKCGEGERKYFCEDIELTIKIEGI